MWLLRRGLESVAVLAVMSLLIYGLIGLMPGRSHRPDGAGRSNLTPADAARLKAL